jgi:CRISPR-associated endonuclease/helicase Cas3
VDKPANVSIKSFYANTHKQLLDEHSFAIAFIAHQLVLRLVDDLKLAMCAFIGGTLHDVGKLEPKYQTWVKTLISGVKKGELPEPPSQDGSHIDNGRFTFETHPRHNEVSLFLFHLLDDPSCRVINPATKDRIRHILYWHHAKPVRAEEFTSLDFIYKNLRRNIGDDGIKDLYVNAVAHITQVNVLSKQYMGDTSLQLVGVVDSLDADRLCALDQVLLPAYKNYSLANREVGDYVENVNKNALHNIARAALISADRIISALSAQQLSQHIKNRTLLSLVDRVAPESASAQKSELSTSISQCLDRFTDKYPASNRNRQQSHAAQLLAEVNGVSILKGPAGCGKTKISLECAVNSGVKKIIWVCPRVQVCESLLHDLTSAEYLPNVAVEICTGALKTISKSGVTLATEEGFEFSGDVVITTADQILKSILTHSNVTSLIEFMQVHVVFDEYHEYINMPAFNLLFAELVRCKQLSKSKAKALLVSATPNYFFTEHLLQLDREDVVGINSFNQTLYEIEFQNFDEAKQDASNPLFALQPVNSIVISNTATTAQRSFILNQTNENAILFHSKYKQSHKSALFELIFQSFKQDGSHLFDTLRSGPIVQASLNITSSHMVSEFTTAENYLQRLGRLGRFGENTLGSHYLTAVPEPIALGKCVGTCARFLSGMKCFRGALAWYQFLQHRLNENQNGLLSIADLYQIYDDFYSSDEGRLAVELDLKEALKESVKVINAKVQDPITLPKTKVQSDRKRLKKSSLRGDSRFVQMAVCDVSAQGDSVIRDQYACDGADATLTMDVDAIEGYDPAGDRNLISFMHQKHHKIMTAKSQKKHTKAHKSHLLKNAAIDSESPIFVSYIPADLALCNDEQHTSAIVYALCDKQPIGMISVSNLMI